LPKEVAKYIVERAENGDFTAIRLLCGQSLFFFLETVWIRRDPLDIPYHLEMANFYQFGGNKLMNIGPRGTYKTTIGNGALIWRLLEHKEETALIVGATYDLASAKVSEIAENIAGNVVLRNTYPDRIPDDLSKNWGKQGIRLVRDIAKREETIEPIGVGGSLAGKHYDNVFLDDLVNEQNYRSPEIIADIKRWFANIDTSLLVNPRKSVVWINGNRWSEDDFHGYIIQNHKKLGYQIFKYNDIWLDEAHKVSIMPNKYPPEVIKNIENSMTAFHGKSFFLAQMRGIITSPEGDVFNIDALTPKENPQGFEEVWCIIDPAISDKASADDTAIVVVSFDDKAQWYIEHITARQGLRPEEIVEIVKTLNETYHFVGVGIETRAYQKALLFAFQALAGSIPVFELPSDTRSKEMRIKSISFKWNAGRIFYNEATADIEKLLVQVRKFNSGSRGHDDVLDALSYTPLLPASVEIEREEEQESQPTIDFVAKGYAYAPHKNYPRLFY
jgi:hypothetical protein